MHRLKRIVIYLCISGVGAALFRWAHAYATERRGYTAYGGEMLLLALPLVAYIIRETAKDTANEIRKEREE